MASPNSTAQPVGLLVGVDGALYVLKLGGRSRGSARLEQCGLRPHGDVNRLVELHGRMIRAESTSAESLNLEFTDVAVGSRPPRELSGLDHNMQRW